MTPSHRPHAVTAGNLFEQGREHDRKKIVECIEGVTWDGWVVCMRLLQYIATQNIRLTTSLIPKLSLLLGQKLRVKE